MSDCGDCDDGGGGGCDYGGGYDGYGNEGGEHYYGSDHHHYEDRPYYSYQSSSNSPMSDVVMGLAFLLIGGGVGGWLLRDSLQSQAVDADFVDLWLFPILCLFVAILGVGLLMKGIQRITSKSKQRHFGTSFNNTNQGGNDGDKNVHAQQMEQQPSSNATQTDSDEKPASLFDQMSKWTSFNNANSTQN